MGNALPPVPRDRMVDDDGNCTPRWAAFFRELWNRAGGGSGQSTTELADTAEALAATVTALSTSLEDAKKGRAL